MDRKFDDRTMANMDVVLEEVCRDLPHGGDHESRKHVAERLMEAAFAGQTSLEALTGVARRALGEIAHDNCKNQRPASRR